MIVKKLILKKVLTAGILAEFHLVRNEGEYQAALFVNGKYVGGPTVPQRLTTPKDNITYWMGNKPSVGLTDTEAEQILNEVEIENKILSHRKRSGWDVER